MRRHQCHCLSRPRGEMRRLWGKNATNGLMGTSASLWDLACLVHDYDMTLIALAWPVVLSLARDLNDFECHIVLRWQSCSRRISVETSWENWNHWCFFAVVFYWAPPYLGEWYLAHLTNNTIPKCLDFILETNHTLSTLCCSATLLQIVWKLGVYSIPIYITFRHTQLPCRVSSTPL